MPSYCTAEEIVIGVSSAFTGPSRGLGIELYRGSKCYFDHVNSNGGVHGKQIVMKAYDDQYSPNSAVNNTIRLIDVDKVFLLFNYVGTPTTTRCLPLLRHQGADPMYLLFPFTGAQPHRQQPYGDLVFNLRASYYQETGGLVDHLVEIGRKRIAVFYQIDAYGRNGWDGTRTALLRHGLQMVGEATYKRGTSFDASMKQQVEILQKSNADAVICIGAYAACAAFIRDCRDAGWDVPIANVSFVGSENLLELLQQSSNSTGRDYFNKLINSQVVPSYADDSLPAVKEYRRLMTLLKPTPPLDLLKEKYEPRVYSFVSLEGFLNAKLLVEILKRAGAGSDRAKVKKVAESIRELDLGIGEKVSFSAERHQAMDRVYFTEVKDGQFVSIVDWKRWRK